MIPQSRQRDTMRGQRFGQYCLLVAFLQSAYGVSGDTFCLGNAIFGQQGSRASVINLSNRARIALCEKQLTSAVEMPVRFVMFSKREEQITKIVFNPREKSSVSSQLKVKTRRRVFHQRSIQIIFSVFRGS